jgi:Na+/melibiose symporter-like transporter
LKNYQKLTIITAILGLILPFIGLFLYFFINSIIGIPLLALFVGWAMLIAVGIIAINIGAIVAAFKIKNTKFVGAILIVCGVLLFLLIQWFAVPALVLFVIAGIMALRNKDKNGISNLSEKFKQT